MSKKPYIPRRGPSIQYQHLSKHYQQNADKAYQKLLDHVVIMARLSWYKPAEEQDMDNPELAYSVDFFGGFNKVLHGLIKQAFGAKHPTIEGAMEALSHRLNTEVMQWIFTLEIHIKKPDGEVYVRGVEMEPDSPTPIGMFTDVYKENRKKLMEGINGNHKIVDIVWKASKNLPQNWEKMEQHNPVPKTN